MYDLAIIGLGPAGCEIAQIAIKNNLNTIAFEKAELGGTCLNLGCIPTKSILYCANIYNEMKNCENIGLSCENIKFNWQEILNRKNNIVQKFNKLLYQSISKNIEIINSIAELNILNDEILIMAEDNIYQAKNIVIATGSVPKELKGLEFNHKDIISSDDLLKLDTLPKSIAITGSGAIGLEWALILKNLQVDVTVIEKMPNLAPVMDIDIQKRVERILKTNNIKFYKDDFITSYNNGIVKLNSGCEFQAQKVLVAVGRKPVLPEVLINQSIPCDICLEDDFSTNFENVYIAGDALNKTMLAHSAQYDAKIIMNKILNKKPLIKKNIPSVIYITPEIASVGIKEQDIKGDSSYIIKKTMVTSIAKSWCDECADGFVKVIIKDNLIKGAHIVSKNASILISIFNILIEQKIPIDEIENFIFPHPCLSELVLEVLK